MATANYTATSNGISFSFTADFARASSPVLMDGDSTPFQVADAQHRPQRAAELLAAWQNAQGGGAIFPADGWKAVKAGP